MGGSTIGSLTRDTAELYAGQTIEQIEAEHPDFFEMWSASELGMIALSAFGQSNHVLLDSISQHAFDRTMDFIRDADFVKPYMQLYRQTEGYLDSLQAESA